jgi:nucleoside 2-deoxyribosyltransferase
VDGKRKKIYISGPLTALVVSEKIKNVIRANQVAAQLINLGFNVFIPHNFHFTEIQAADPITYEEWLALDFEWIEECDALFVINHSPGTDREIDFCKNLGIPVFYDLYSLQLWAETEEIREEIKT